MSEETSPSPFGENPQVKELQAAMEKLRSQIQKVIVGHHKSLDLIMIALFSGGHALLEGVPGIAKTLMAKMVAQSLSVQFNRAQFTPDLMPSDLLGTSVFNMQKSTFEFKAGPVFTNILLIDEINRAPAKTQAALFEVMEERQATIDGKRHIMEEPYLVLATQNPIDHEGTYKLPEAQLDRFMFKVNLGYPELNDEVEILQRHLEWRDATALQIEPVMTGAELLRFQKLIAEVRVEPDLLQYIAKVVKATRNDPSLYLGASPRASLALLYGARTWAAFQGRDFVTPDDVKFLAVPALQHRVVLTPEREMEGYQISEVIESLVKQIEVPR